jgi:hypothetical protein
MDSLTDIAFTASDAETPVQWLEDTFTIRKSLGYSNPCSGQFFSLSDDHYDPCFCQDTTMPSFGGKHVSSITWEMDELTKAAWIEWLHGFDWDKEEPPRYLA